MGLNELRAEIDSIDEQVVALVNRRYEIVREVGKWKRDRSSAYYVPEREKALLERLEKINQGPLPNRALRAIYREIMSGALALEHPLKIGFLGPEASFTQLAAVAKFGDSVEYEPKSNIADVFQAVWNEQVDYGCVPIENSHEGVVNHTLDMFIDSPVSICAEINLRIRHCLMAKGAFSEIRGIYSHAQVFGQCRDWLRENAAGIETVETPSTAKAAERAVEEAGTAAIASELASRLYDLPVLAENIEDNPENVTRFLLLGKQFPKPTGDDKTSIVFALKDKVGALYDCLLPFKDEDVTLTMIESRPSRRRNWQYSFFIDALGHAEDKPLSRAIDKLKDICPFVKILGSYPRAAHVI